MANEKQGYFPIDAPPAVPPSYGLTASLPVESRSLEEWGTGITYSPEGCVEGETYDKCDPPTLTPTERPATVEWMPYVLSVYTHCTTFGDAADADLSRATRLLNMDTERQLGHEFWTGELAQASTLPVSNDPWPNGYLASTDSDDLSADGPKNLVHALSCLDQYLTDHNGGQPGAVHATAQTVVQWYSLRVIQKEGGRWRTPNGNIVISSPGYTGSSPEGRAPSDNDIWAYATDIPRIYLSAPMTFPILEQVDRANNDVLVTAQRMGLVEWERCRHGAVQMLMEVCGEGGS